jgi:hypothetical protein
MTQSRLDLAMALAAERAGGLAKQVFEHPAQ